MIRLNRRKLLFCLAICIIIICAIDNIRYNIRNVVDTNTNNILLVNRNTYTDVIPLDGKNVDQVNYDNNPQSEKTKEESKTISKPSNVFRNYSVSNLEDTSRSYVTPWKKMSDCRHFHIRFALPNSLSTCALASFPGSGNTWTRYMIESSTGLFSGTRTPDPSLYTAGFLGELERWDIGTTIVQKVHDFSTKTVKSFDGRGILVIRNPYKAILSFHNFLFTDHKLYAPMVAYRSKDWEPFVIKTAKDWMDTFNIWMKNSKDLLVIYYEDLVEEPSKYLKEINNFLGIPVCENRIKCILKEKKGRFKRNKQYFAQNITLFSDKSSQMIDKAIDYLTFLSKSRGHSAPPLEKYEFYRGTSSKLKFESCKKDEDLIDCDNRIDTMNLNIWNPFVASKENGKKIEKDVVSWARGFFYKAMYHITENPIKAVIKATVEN